MSLITKYRPKRWEDVIGQDEAVASLKESVSKRSSQAYLFTGPSGTGKTTLARILAMELGCDENDIREVDAGTYTGIDDMRTLTDSLKYRPLGKSNIKMIIIDEAHGLSRPASNALLKSLEEPPSWVYFSLCTTEPGRILTTIKTRCTNVNLKTVRPTLLHKLLDDVRRREEVDIDDSILDVCVKEAEGSPRAALSNMGLCFAARDREEAVELLKSAYESLEGVDLARGLCDGLPWEKLRDIIARIDTENVESARHHILRYIAKVALSTPSKQMPYVLAILDAFDQPFPDNQRQSSLILATGKVLFGAEHP